MDKTKKVFLGIGVLAAIAVITFAFAIAASGSDGGVIDQNAEGVTVAASEVTSCINYQGRLTDSAGELLSGTYTMTFGLYDVSTGGTALATDSHDVDVTDGLFNTGIDFGTSDFDGRELWLGVKVGTDPEMTPRQELRPVPYALSLVPGARIDGSISGSVLKINNTGTGAGVHGVYGETSGNWGWASGVYGKATEDYAIGVTGRNTGSGAGVYGWSNEGPGVIGTSDNDTGMYGIGKYGGYFTTNQGGTDWSDKTAGVNATTAYDLSDGVHASTSGDYSNGVRVYTSGREGYGVYAHTSGKFSDGVRASTYGDNSYGVRAYTAGDGSDGVRVSTFGDRSDGVCAYTYGDNSDAVYACSAKGYGVYGKGKYGGYFTTNQAGTGDGHTAGVNATTTYDYSDGVRAHTTGVGSSGVRVDTSGDGSPGVSAYTSGFGSRGVNAYTTGDRGHGVEAYTTGDYSTGVHARSTKFHGVYGRTDSADSAGVYAMGKDSGADLILGGNADTSAGDDGAIYSDPEYTSSDIFLISNDGVAIVLDKNGDGEDADFEIRDKDNKLIFNVDESGDMYASGTKNAVVATGDYGTRKMYALESTEVWFEDFGMTQLQDGVAVVEIDPVFAETVNLSVAYHVFFTPVDGWAPIYVANKTSTSFELRDANDKADITLEYRIVARRLGYEDVRMVQVEPGNEEA